MIDLAMAGNDNERLVLRLIMAMEDGDLAERVGELCTEDFSWANSGLATIDGLAALYEQMAGGGFATEIPLLAEMTHFSADLLHIASRDDVVFTERIDHHWSADGRDLMTPHICGIAELRNGRISAFRDFYDTACYQQQPTPPDPAFTLANFRAARG
jgi:limonene-1,2-epoxide hydrolase